MAKVFSIHFSSSYVQIVIQDTSLLLGPADIKAYVLMTMKGLEYLHSHWILHRVRRSGHCTRDGQYCRLMSNIIHFSELHFNKS